MLLLFFKDEGKGKTGKVGSGFLDLSFLCSCCLPCPPKFLVLSVPRTVLCSLQPGRT